MSYYSSGLITQAGELLNGPTALANGVLVCNADGTSVVSSIDSILGFTPANDAAVVHLAGTETITGQKTFTSGVHFSPPFGTDVTIATNRRISYAASGTTGSMLGNPWAFFGLGLGSEAKIGWTAGAVNTSSDVFLKRATVGAVGVYQADGTTLGTLQAATIQGAAGSLVLQASSSTKLNINTAETLTYQKVRPTSNNSIDSGDATYNWRSGYFGTSVVTPKIQSTSSPVIIDGTEIQFALNGATPSIRFGGVSFRPWNTSLGLTLGSSAIPWSGVFTNAVTITDSTSGHTIYGYNAGVSNTGARIVAFGQQALQNNIGDYCTAVGYVAGYSNSGASLAALGYAAGQYNQGPGLSVVGHQAGLSNTGSYGTGVGYRAIQNNTGDYVSAIGTNAGDGNTGDNCVFIGRQAGLSNTTANRFELKQNNVNNTPLISGDFSTGVVTLAKLNHSHGIAFRSGSSDPTTIELTSGYGTRWKNTTSGEIRDWVNDGGVMKKSAAYAA